MCCLRFLCRRLVNVLNDYVCLTVSGYAFWYCFHVCALCVLIGMLLLCVFVLLRCVLYVLCVFAFMFMLRYAVARLMYVRCFKKLSMVSVVCFSVWLLYV